MKLSPEERKALARVAYNPKSQVSLSQDVARPMVTRGLLTVGVRVGTYQITDLGLKLYQNATHGQED